MTIRRDTQKINFVFQESSIALLSVRSAMVYFWPPCIIYILCDCCIRASMRVCLLGWNNSWQMDNIRLALASYRIPTMWSKIQHRTAYIPFPEIVLFQSVIICIAYGWLQTVRLRLWVLVSRLLCYPSSVPCRESADYPAIQSVACLTRCRCMQNLFSS